MKKQASAQTTVISGDLRTMSPTKPAPIGFKRSQEDQDTPDQLSVIAYNELAQHLGKRSEVDNAVLRVIRDYFEKRVRLCYTEGLNKELLVMLDKIYIRFYDKSF